MSKSLGCVADCCWTPSIRYQSTVSSRMRMTWSPVITARELSGAAESAGGASCAEAQGARAAQTQIKTSRFSMVTGGLRVMEPWYLPPAESAKRRPSLALLQQLPQVDHRRLRP